MNPSNTYGRNLAIGLVVVAGAAVGCLPARGTVFSSARPDDAREVARQRFPGGTDGGGADGSLFISQTPFPTILDAYASRASDLGGETAFFEDGASFDVGGECLDLASWSNEILSFGFRHELPADKIAELDAAPGSFIELEPDDCDFSS